MAPKHPPGPAMTLGNMRELVVQRLVVSCLNDALRSHRSALEGGSSVQSDARHVDRPVFR